MNVFKCSFAVQSINDIVNQIGAMQAPVGLGISALVSSTPTFWIETNTDGESRLCTTKTDYAPLAAIFTSSSGTTYTINATPFQEVDFFGGHPVHKPI